MTREKKRDRIELSQDDRQKIVDGLFECLASDDIKIKLRAANQLIRIDSENLKAELAEKRIETEHDHE